MPDPRPSVTAAVVASTLLLLRDDDELGHLAPLERLPDLEGAVREVIPALGVLLDRVPWPVLRRAAFGAERLLSPGFVAHYAIRKHAVATELLRAVDDGFRQVVLVGAGFDMMSASVPDSARVFEVDHPATQEAKRAALARSRSELGHVTFVPADLGTERLRDVLLGAPGFDPTRPTVYVAEGLLMYLPRARVQAILGDMRGAGPHATRAIVTVITPDDAGRLRLHSQRRVVDWLMRWLDEPFVWGVHPDDVEPLFAAHGFAVEAMSTTAQLRGRSCAKLPHARLPRATGELVVVARGAGALERAATAAAERA